MKRLQRRQAEEINELRRLLQERNNNNTPTFIIQNTTPTPVIQQVPVPRRIKRTVRSPQEEPPVAKSPTPIEVPRPIPISKPEPEPEPTVIVPIEKPKPAAVEPKVIPKPKPVVNDYPRLTKIYFSPILNPGLLQFDLRDGIEISILEKTSPNDLVFELRRKIAERVSNRLHTF